MLSILCCCKLKKILFDNYFGYPGWKLHEHKVVEELLKGRFEYLGYGGGARCVIRITR